MADDDQDRKSNRLLLAGIALLGAGVVMLTMPAPKAAPPPPAPTPKPGPPPPGPTPKPPPAPTPKPPPPPPAPAVRTVTVCGCRPDGAGNCTTWCSTLWGIAAQMYGNGALYPRIYAANAAQIEAAARAHGLASSDGGHWIYPGTVLVIP